MKNSRRLVKLNLGLIGQLPSTAPGGLKKTGQILKQCMLYSYRNSKCAYADCKSVAVLTYLLTPWCRVLLEKLTGLQLVKKFPAFHETRRFITALTSVRHLSLSWASPIQSIYPHPTSWRSILILYTHLCLGLPSSLLPSGFPTKTLYTSLSSPIRALTHYCDQL